MGIGEIYRQFFIHSHLGLRLGVPNEKANAYWWLCDVYFDVLMDFIEMHKWSVLPHYSVADDHGYDGYFWKPWTPHNPTVY